MTVGAQTGLLTVPRWQDVADWLDALAGGPSAQQVALASGLGLELTASLPSPVAAVVLQHRLSAELGLRFRTAGEVPEVLGDIEDELAVVRTASLLTGTREELSAWFGSRYLLMTARGLRALQPQIGDVVRCAGWGARESRVISSIHDSGRIFMKGRPVRGAWPNHLEVVERIGSAGHSAAVKAVAESVVNSIRSTTTNLDNFRGLAQFELPSRIPAPEAIRALEEVLESGERREEPLQKVLTEYPALLASTVVGGWKTFVIPKPRLGGEYVPDFLVLGINSVGPQWLTVEIEGAQHPIVTRARRLSAQTRHAVDQVSDWREWLSRNVTYAQVEKGYHGLTTQAPGLVIIGRDDPVAERQASRARSEEEARIAVHSWDWLLRESRTLAARELYTTRFAADNLNQQVGKEVVSLSRQPVSTFDDPFGVQDDGDPDETPW